MAKRVSEPMLSADDTLCIERTRERKGPPLKRLLPNAAMAPE